MSERKSTLPALAFWITVIVILPMALLHFVKPGAEAVTIAEPVDESKIRTDFGKVGRNPNGYLYTAEHDGHKFVVDKNWGSAGIAMMHHPDCPCGK